MATLPDFRALIAENGWSASGLAQEFGLAQSTVYHWLRGQHLPTPCAVYAVAGLLGLSVECVRSALAVSQQQYREARRQVGEMARR